MINRIIKNISEKSYIRDLERLDLSEKDTEISEIKDIGYIDDDLAEHRLDIYYKNDRKPKPVIIDIHGGGFISGYKEMDSLFSNHLAQRGYTVFTVNYRLAYPEYNVFDQIDDISNAVKWILENASKYEGNTDDLYIVGHSAGGVLAVAEALLCTDEQMREDYNAEDRKYDYNGIILDCGVMNFYKRSIGYWGMRNMVFPKGYNKMNKYRYLVFDQNDRIASLPKTVLITNERDELRGMTLYFKNILDNRNVGNLLIDSGSSGHMGIIYTPYSDDNQSIIHQIADYYKSEKHFNERVKEFL